MPQLIFARWATDNYWDVAEDFVNKIPDLRRIDFGNRVVFPNSRYNEMRGLADQHAAPAK